MKVLLIQPPFNRLKGLGWTTYPLGLGYLAAVIENAGHQCLIYNCELKAPGEIGPAAPRHIDRFHNHRHYIEALANSEHHVWQEVGQVLKEFAPDFIGLTLASQTFDSGLKIASIAKELFPNVSIVAGGPHATALPEDVLADENIDYLVLGEGETALLELLKQFETGNLALEKIPGLCGKTKDGIHIGELGPRIKDIDDLPYPNRDALHLHKGTKGHFNNVLGARGCPYRCSFCSSRNVWGKKVSNRSPKALFDELMFIKETYGSMDFVIYDDTFTSNFDRFLEFSQIVRDNGVPFLYTCSTRADRLNEKIVDTLKSSGCRLVSFGVEASDEKLLKNIGKGITLEDVERSVKLLHDAGIPFGAYFIVGYPDETIETMNKTYEMMEKIKAEHLYLTVLAPYPATPLYDDLRERELIPEKPDWKFYGTASPYRVLCKEIPPSLFWEQFTVLSKLVDKTNQRSFREIERKLKLAATDPKKAMEKLWHKIVGKKK